MPDILIRGMEMPKSCFICPFCVPEADEENGEMCMATGRLFGLPSQIERDESCPLLELPPHGDLIDLNKIIEMLTMLAKHEGNWRASCILGVVNTIKETPVIVPANKEVSE